MASPGSHNDEAINLVDSIATMLHGSDSRVAVAESLTGGEIAVHLAVGESSSEWFAGGVVAYAADVKFRALGVTPGPVVTAAAAQEMAAGVAKLMAATVTVAVTGVGGPDEQEGQPVGTVFIGVRTPFGEHAEERHFDGDAREIVAATTVAALKLLEASIRHTVN
ncbi:MAG: CinA domain protein [Homoserinimonas sp.]|jgi:nicotinamide-nucleotide amidase|nr:CinA domain protein [Homoserinimonas sp.]